MSGGDKDTPVEAPSNGVESGPPPPALPLPARLEPRRNLAVAVAPKYGGVSPSCTAGLGGEKSAESALTPNEGDARAPRSLTLLLLFSDEFALRAISSWTMELFRDDGSKECLRRCRAGIS